MDTNCVLVKSTEWHNVLRSTKSKPPQGPTRHPLIGRNPIHLKIFPRKLEANSGVTLVRSVDICTGSAPLLTPDSGDYHKERPVVSAEGVDIRRVNAPAVARTVSTRIHLASAQPLAPLATYVKEMIMSRLTVLWSS